MPAKQVSENLYAAALGSVNAFLLRGPDRWVLIDTGLPKSADKVLAALAGLGGKPSDLRHILLTHAHSDHIGSAAALQQASGADISIHAVDEPIASAGTGFRPLKPAPGVFNKLLFTMVHATVPQKVDPVRVGHRMEDGEILPYANALRVIHTPGHCAGQVAFLLSEGGGVLIAADTCMHVMGLALTMAYEDIDLGRSSLKKLAAFEFNIAVFGHGKPLMRNAAAEFRARFA